MERITRTQVDNAARFLNDLIPGEMFVSVQALNGGLGVDLCYLAEGTQRHARTIAFGTKREVYDFLRAMREGILLSRGQ